jgi:hypothetical protein
VNLLDQVRAEQKTLYARNDELTSRNVSLENQLAELTARQLRQSEVLCLSDPKTLSASLLNAGEAGKTLEDVIAQREHVIDVLRTEVHAADIKACDLGVRYKHQLCTACNMWNSLDVQLSPVAASDMHHNECS